MTSPNIMSRIDAENRRFSAEYAEWLKGYVPPTPTNSVLVISGAVELRSLPYHPRRAAVFYSATFDPHERATPCALVDVSDVGNVIARIEHRIAWDRLHAGQFIRVTTEAEVAAWLKNLDTQPPIG